ncbi:hypothetical protein DdX_20318 [Ditylenchus destructor]|uniref:Uncharacterized protein n=1 Tax=Ditylenchus destructor TaxID=166010 RepID=A0AAD4QRW8_9BILA|nr:hypothetical protein DdX_20318 [Ditylenchus destructor]
MLQNIILSLILLLLIITSLQLADVILAAAKFPPSRGRHESYDLAHMKSNALNAAPTPSSPHLLARLKKHFALIHNRSVQDQFRRIITLPSPRKRRAAKPTLMVRIETVTTPKPRVRRYSRFPFLSPPQFQ